MTVTARVEKVRSGMAKVATERPESCNGCPSNAICNARHISQWVVNSVGAEVGDAVMVSTGTDSRSLLLVSYIFLCPVAILLLSSFLFTINPYFPFIAVPLATAFFVSLNIINKKYKNSSEIIKILSEEEFKLCAKE